MLALRGYHGAKMAVMGLGRSGLAAARALEAAGADVVAWDDDPAARRRAAAGGVKLAPLAAFDFSSLKALVLSPGIPHIWPRPHEVAARARAAATPILTEAALLADSTSQARSIGVTGTDGKSTVSALIAHILRRADIPCCLGGNFGTPATALDPLPEQGVYVLEMSSFQLELAAELTFDIAVFLNLSCDHGARYPSMESYAASKKRIFAGAPPGAVAVIGVDDDWGRRFYAEISKERRRRVVAVSSREKVEGGLYVCGQSLIDNRQGKERPVFDFAQSPRLRGSHGKANAAAAAACALALDVGVDVLGAAFSDFRPLPHRQQELGERDGVLFVNDSKATTAASAAAALAAYGGEEEGRSGRAIFWIAGGLGKGGDYHALRPVLSHVAAVFLIGAEASALKAFLGRHAPSLTVSICRDLDDATARAAMDARAFHDRYGRRAVVLLSPACASQDAWRDFAERGEAFCKLARPFLKAPSPALREKGR